jgi:hypothetical protein
VLNSFCIQGEPVSHCAVFDDGKGVFFEPGCHHLRQFCTRLRANHGGEKDRTRYDNRFFHDGNNRGFLDRFCNTILALIGINNRCFNAFIYAIVIGNDTTAPALKGTSPVRSGQYRLLQTRPANKFSMFIRHLNNLL